jgi:hypothetical protein
MRPGRARCHARPALSWSCAALRGLRPRLTRTHMGCVRPARRFDARRALASRDLPNRIAPDGGPPCTFALLQRSIARPPHRPAGPKADPSDDASSPGLSCRTTRAGTADPRIAEPPGPAACRVRGLGTPCAASTTVPPDAFRRRSVLRLLPSRRSPRVDRTPSRRSLPSWRCSRRFASSPRGTCGRGRLQGFDPGANSCGPSDPEGPEASMPSWDSPFRALSPSGREPCFGRRASPPSRVGWCDVQSHLRLGELRREGVGWPLSGLPALLGFITLRPSRRRSGRRAGWAYGFASRLARVAGGANRSEPRRRRPSRRRSADPSSAVHR